MPRRRRTKWHRRGQAVAEFVVAFLIVLVTALVRMMGVFVHQLVRGLWWARDRSPGRTAQHAVAAGGARVNGRPGKSRLVEPVTVPSVRFHSVAGLEFAKQEILVRTVYPLRHPEQASAYKVETGGGVMLIGPPGCGKTLLARGVAGELDAHFYHVRASTLIDQWVGMAEKNVAALFQQVRGHRCSVLFIDEIDALCPSRRRNRSTVMRRVLAEFLSQMDGVDTACRRSADDGFLLVLGATNWPEALDEAILRPGRFDVRVFVGLPDATARRHIIEKRLTDRPVSTDVSTHKLAVKTEGFSGADVANLVENAARHAFLRAVRDRTDNRVMSWQDFLDSLKDVQPSISPRELRRYDELHRELSGGTACIPRP